VSVGGDLMLDSATGNLEMQLTRLYGYGILSMRS